MTVPSPATDQSNFGVRRERPTITTVIFDVDDTLYDVGTGFTAYRNTDGATSFMVDRLNFSSKEEAQKLRDEYFARYHSTAKGLTVAEEEGRLPPLPEGTSLPEGKTKLFDPADLDEYWATNLDYSYLGGPDPKCVEMFEYLSKGEGPCSELDLVVFSNGPRKYVSRALEEMDLMRFFPANKLFSVTDVLPHCKPDKGSFDQVLQSVGAKAEECVMVEDSMKNVRAAKALGMKTILVVGKGKRGSGSEAVGDTEKKARAPGDAPDESDPAVDAIVEVASEVGDVLKKWLEA